MRRIAWGFCLLLALWVGVFAVATQAASVVQESRPAFVEPLL